MVEYRRPLREELAFNRISEIMTYPHLFRHFARRLADTETHWNAPPDNLRNFADFFVDQFEQIDPFEGQAWRGAENGWLGIARRSVGLIALSQLSINMFGSADPPHSVTGPEGTVNIWHENVPLPADGTAPTTGPYRMHVREEHLGGDVTEILGQWTHNPEHGLFVWAARSDLHERWEGIGEKGATVEPGMVTLEPWLSYREFETAGP